LVALTERCHPNSQDETTSAPHAAAGGQKGHTVPCFQPNSIASHRPLLAAVGAQALPRKRRLEAGVASQQENGIIKNLKSTH